jgi:lipopolysaccharide/colanic/teichoic acid biosynthesis glycosyltransferase
MSFGIVVVVFWGIISAPLTLIIALAINLESHDPIVHPSQRVGNMEDRSSATAFVHGWHTTYTTALQPNTLLGR